MTSSKSVSWSALINIGNNESLALTVSGEAANPDEARDIFAFACGQLLGVANSADEATAPLIRAYVSRLVQTEEARPVEQDAVPATPPSAEEQAAAAVTQCIKPPATTPDPAPSAPQSGEVCVNCGAAVSASQAKLSQLFQSKTLCKSCMEATA